MEYTGYPISQNEYSNMLDNANDTIFDLRHEIDELKEKLNKSNIAMVYSFLELNAIKARNGAPQGVSPIYFEKLVDYLNQVVTENTGKTAHCHPLLNEGLHPTPND